MCVLQKFKFKHSPTYIVSSFFFFFCSFLAKRGVKEDIATFEARNISTEIRQSVEELLNRNKASFDPKVRSSESNLDLFSLYSYSLSCYNGVSSGT